MGSTEIHIIHENNLMSKLDCYSQSTHSLPAMVSRVLCIAWARMSSSQTPSITLYSCP